ncbi:DUF1311 domain-containing protein [Bosea caraganae]|uniref:DUF1311 domain-containing protein n=1 Tax=Bosea caraganae TaxID=2763117 RepID=A0A370L3W8_9HYPH|nr:DUF1311 domain-containing protein [Bosea caraganae]RDJ28876.1 DUF1311 domain-containing protein [Bosea caraganae]
MILLGGLLLASAGPAAADDIYDKCIDDSDGTNTAWGACGSEWLKREDEKLNAVWKRINDGLPDATKADLLEEQRAWIAFKEKSCRFYANGDWGREGQALHYPNCLASLIAERISTLEAYGAFFKQN